MRVAVVGKIKAGKSTMINALLGEYLVSTGPEELTFNVNWLKYGASPDLKVHFKDGRKPESKLIEELDALTRRRDENSEFLRNIKFIEVFYPNEILKKISLIDTPGLESFFDSDSRNTLEFLQVNPKEIKENTQRELSNADAVLYLFNQGMAVTDQSVLEEFIDSASGNSTPINSIGVLTKADSYWPNYPEPLAAGHEIGKRLISEHSQIRSVFYAIYPVCGLLAIGAKTLSEENMQALEQLSNLSQEDLDRVLRTAERFNRKEYPNRPYIPSTRQRSNLWHKIGKYGIFLACDLIRSGTSTQTSLADKLFSESGVDELRALILSHFGNRAFLIKLGTGIRQILLTCDATIRNSKDSERRVVEAIAGDFETLQSQEHSFKELELLCEYYKNRLLLSPEEVKNLLEVTGEFGLEIWKRLGTSKETSKNKNIRIAEERRLYWHQKSQDIMNLNESTLRATKVMVRSYEKLIYVLESN